jgi:hypothetical protein
MNGEYMNETVTEASASAVATAPQWMHDLMDFRQRLFLQTVEPIIVTLVGPVVDSTVQYEDDVPRLLCDGCVDHVDQSHRRLGFLPSYVSNVKAFKETSMSFATLIVLFVTLSCVFLIFLSCFYHNQKTSPLFISPRRHRLPKLVPPPLPVDGYFSWVKVCFFLSDEEIINRIGYDSLIFLRFHRLALRCIVKMSIFSFFVLLPLNFTGGGHANAQDLKEYVGSLFFTDFLRFTMANVQSGSPRLWVYCFAAYLLTGIVVRELLVEYETFNAIRHRYLLSREPHLRTVLVTNIPRHLRSASKITNYFRHVYPQAVKAVFMCQNLIPLEKMVVGRTAILSRIEKELLLLCRFEKRKLYEQSWMSKFCSVPARLQDCGVIEGRQERLASLYAQLEELNTEIEREQQRRRRVMKMLDRMEAGEGRKEIDYVLASPFITDDPAQRRVLGLPHVRSGSEYKPPAMGGQESTLPETIPEGNEREETEPHQAGNNTSTSTRTSQLRSRSPAAVEPSRNDESPRGDFSAKFSADKQQKEKNKPVKSIANAKAAIRSYSQFNQDVSFLGRPIRTVDDFKSERHIEDHINEVTDKAFVVMRTFTAATIAIQSMHSSKPGAMQVATAPEPRDILWGNIYMSKGAHRTRSYIGEFLVLLLITFYVVPVAMVSLLVSESALISSSPRLAQLDQASAFFSAAIALVQPLCIVGLQQLLPPLFILIGKAEGLTSFSEVQMRAFSRYFLFQVVNVFLVTTIAGSIFDTVAIIIENPESAFEMLGNSLPRMSSFFITFITIKTFLALGFELVRSMALLQATVRYFAFPNSTLRMQRTVIMGMRSIDDPGWFPFHKILAQDMLVVVVSVVFAVVAPLVLLPCALFCLFSRIMWTHHHLYVYESVFESGGQFWPKIFRRFVFGLIIAQMTITGQFILKEARHEAYATIALMFMTYFFLRSTRARYDPASFTLPLEVATVMDISLQQEEAAMRQVENARRPQDGDANRHADPGAPMEGEHVGSTEAFIGRHDPFRKAYLQPALRANPRARPEQPFPVAQLGRPEAFFGTEVMTDSNDSDLQDSNATVRLKSMNQLDRRLVNRWWNDQLQRCGEPNLYSILIGEECGTLTLSSKNDGDDELQEQQTMASTHSFV